MQTRDKEEQYNMRTMTRDGEVSCRFVKWSPIKSHPCKRDEIACSDHKKLAELYEEGNLETRLQSAMLIIAALRVEKSLTWV